MCTRFVEVRKQDRRSVAVRLQIKVDHRGSTFGRPSVVDLWWSTFGRPSRLRRENIHGSYDTHGAHGTHVREALTKKKKCWKVCFGAGKFFQMLESV